MNIFKILETIESAVYSSQRMPWPFNEWSLIHRHNFLRLLDKMRQSVPEEVKQARAVSKEAQRLVQDAQQTAQEILETAREQAKSMGEAARVEREGVLNATDVVREARAVAEELERTARTRAEQLEGQTRARCHEVRATAEAHAVEIRRKADAYALATRETAETESRAMLEAARAQSGSAEDEIDAYALRILSLVERDLGRALDVVKSNRELVQRPRAAPEAGPPRPEPARPASSDGSGRAQRAHAVST